MVSTGKFILRYCYLLSFVNITTYLLRGDVVAQL